MKFEARGGVSGAYGRRPLGVDGKLATSKTLQTFVRNESVPSANVPTCAEGTLMLKPKNILQPSVVPSKTLAEVKDEAAERHNIGLDKCAGFKSVEGRLFSELTGLPRNEWEVKYCEIENLHRLWRGVLNDVDRSDADGNIQPLSSNFRPDNQRLVSERRKFDDIQSVCTRGETGNSHRATPE